jgi:16S rRNA (guanine(966)-N(2))-methyltransferase RsmD
MDTRPTSDKVREAIFGVLAGSFEEQPVLDLYAGTGALGIEALSRGASHAVFVERRVEACKVIRANLAHTHFEEQARLMCMDVRRAIPTLGEGFGLILVDPPYAMAESSDILILLGSGRVVGVGTVVVFEHSPRFAVQERYARLVLQRQKVYGDTAVSMFVVQEEDSE